MLARYSTFFVSLSHLVLSNDVCTVADKDCHTGMIVDEETDGMKTSLFQRKNLKTSDLRIRREELISELAKIGSDLIARDTAPLSKEMGEPVFEVVLAKDEVSSEVLHAREERLRAGPVKKLYHQTTKEACQAIVTTRFYNGHGGLVGGGIYFAMTAEQTYWKAQKRGCMIESWVAIGKEKKVPFEGDKSLTGAKNLNEGFDSVWIPRGCSSGPCLPSPAPEQIVYYADQILEMSAFACDAHGNRNGPYYTEKLSDQAPKFERSEGVPRGPTPPPTPTPPTPAPIGKSCAATGCGGDYKPSDHCQCTWACTHYNNCCTDFHKSCDVASFCAARGCQTRYDPSKSCQCNRHCATYGNCCKDYYAQCR